MRPERVCLAAGGEGGGKGRSSKRSKKAPKCSSLRALIRRFRVSAKITIPATVTPITTHVFGFEALVWIKVSDFDMTRSRRRRERERKEGFRRV